MEVKSSGRLLASSRLPLIVGRPSFSQEIRYICQELEGRSEQVLDWIWKISETKPYLGRSTIDLLTSMLPIDTSGLPYFSTNFFICSIMRSPHVSYKLLAQLCSVYSTDGGRRGSRNIVNDMTKILRNNFFDPCQFRLVVFATTLFLALFPLKRNCIDFLASKYIPD